MTNDQIIQSSLDRLSEAIDRELLELAAKAAGIKIDKSKYSGGGHGNTGFDLCGNAVLDWHNGTRWNPLSDDGDALRLAVKLRMEIDHNHPADEIFWVSACSANQRLSEVEEFDDEIQREASTRRAIVRAAAEIGKAMP